MGFWDVIGDRLKGITPDLSTVKRAAYDCASKIDQAVRVDGIQKLPQYVIGDRLKGITPDLSTAKRAAYDCASKIDQAVRVDGIQKLPQYLPDDETRSQIGLFTTTLAKNTRNYVVREGFKHIPGATVAAKLVSQTMLEIKQEKHKDRAKAMQSQMDRSEENLKKSTSQSEISTQNNKLSSHNEDGDGARKFFEQKHKIISKI